MYIYIHTYICTYIHIYIYTNVCIYIFVCMYMYIDEDDGSEGEELPEPVFKKRVVCALQPKPYRGASLIRKCPPPRTLK